MASPMVRELLDAGIHFGHHCSRWNPKMKPFIYGKRNSIHIIDIRETIRGLLRAQKLLSRIVAANQDVLFVGTKRQAKEAVQSQALRCGMHYVNERWLGGTLTNFRTIRSRLERLQELEELIESPRWETGYSKKMKSTLSRELRKIRRNLDGIRRMEKLPGALVVIDVRKETNAVREARALKIPTLCLIDTDGDPDFAALAIPGNDDAMRAIQLVVTKLADAVEEGRRARPTRVAEPEGAESGAASAPRRRSRRTTTSRAEPQGAPPAQAVQAQAVPAEAAPIEAPPLEAPPLEAPPADAAVGVAEAAPTLAGPVPAPESLPESVGTSAGAGAEPAGDGGPAPTS